MPVATVTHREAPNATGITTFNGAKDTGGKSDPQGIGSTHLFQTFGRGVPRRENLAAIRVLENTPVVQLPLTTILGQVATSKWRIAAVDEEDDEDPAIQASIEDITDWFDGPMNTNEETFQVILKKWVRDMLSVDAGVLELVGDGSQENWLRELWARDGLSFTKAPDEHDRLPVPGSQEAAYWQFSMSGLVGAVNDNSALYDALQQDVLFDPNRHVRHEPVPFNRDMIAWLEENPRSYDPYGVGRVQMVKKLVELILNMDFTNLGQFTHGELPDGLVSLLEANQDEVDRFREYMDEEIAGKEHKVVVVGGKQVEWTAFNPGNKEMQFLESQKWYHQLVWMVFGLSPNEVGSIEDVNRSTAENQSVTVFRKTTRPLLELIQGVINRSLLIHLEAYKGVEGRVQFEFVFEHPGLEDRERFQQQQDLNDMLTTINEVRTARGRPGQDWGDMPLALARTLATQEPRWFLEEVVGWEGELPPEGLGNVFLGASVGDIADRAFHSHDALTTWTDKEVKEALRNEPGYRYPALAGIADAMRERVAGILREVQDEVVSEVEANRSEKGLGFDIAKILGGISIADRLRSVVIDEAVKAVREAAEYHARELEEAVQAGLEPGDPEVEFVLDGVENTRALQALEANAGLRMRGVEQFVKEQVKDTILGVAGSESGTVQAATEAIRERFDFITDSHARLIARTETLDAGRTGSQALAESTDLIAGKEWKATNDNRTRSWHAVMDGVKVAKDESFLVPKTSDAPPNFPKRAFKVGDSDPFNCRCDQSPVLSDDMPERIQQLYGQPGWRRRHEPRYDEDLTERQREALFCYGKGGERFRDMMHRLDDEHGTREALMRFLGVSKASLYQWLGKE